MQDDILQLLPPGGQQRKMSDAWQAINDRFGKDRRSHDGISRTSVADERVAESIIPQTFWAKITGATAQTAISGFRNWWKYEWVEVERHTSDHTWPTITNGRTDALYGKAINAYETTVDDDGENSTSATPIRLVIPNNAVVNMMIDTNGRAAFSQLNPVAVC